MKGNTVLCNTLHAVKFLSSVQMMPWFEQWYSHQLSVMKSVRICIFWMTLPHPHWIMVDPWMVNYNYPFVSYAWSFHSLCIVLIIRPAFFENLDHNPMAAAHRVDRGNREHFCNIWSHNDSIEKIGKHDFFSPLGVLEVR